MTTVTECPHGMDDPSWCADCLAIDRPPRRIYGFHEFPAADDGRCLACDEPIHEGDLIVGVTDEDGERVGYVHAEHRR
ncbi:MAG: hypothetical protein KY469_10665 [Actinobacteria bacterium]|nr:hypothetical protein [Actinomycetota bacterium]